MDDDFNTAGALGELFELVRAINRFADAGKLESNPDPKALADFRAGVVVLRELLGLRRGSEHGARE